MNTEPSQQFLTADGAPGRFMNRLYRRPLPTASGAVGYLAVNS